MCVNGFKAVHCAAAHLWAAILAAVLCCASAAAVAASLSPQQAFAADQDATLAVVVKYGSGSSAVSIDGMKLSAYEVARIGNNGYELLDAYSSTGYDFNEKFSAHKTQEAAKALAELAKAQTAAASATTGGDGTASFGTVEPGVYLVVQTGASGTAAGYNTLDAFLVNAPQVMPTEIVYDVVAEAKPSVIPSSSSSPSPSSSSSSPSPSSSSSSPPPTTNRTTPSTNSSMAKTGDNIDWRITALCTGTGLLALGTAVFASRKLKR